MVRLLALVVLCHAVPSNADNTVAAGGIVGVTVGPSPYFPSYFVGATADIYREVAGPLSIGFVARVQFYYGAEDAGFGSWGFQQDLSLALRVNAFRHDESRAANPFLSVHAGLAVVELVPFHDPDPTDFIAGYILGGSVGVDVRGNRERPPLEARLAFDIRSFGTNQGAAAPLGELSLALLGAYRW